MPIIDLAASDDPLCQGDILQGISLRSTGTPWDADPASTVTHPHRLCIVISRPCNALRDETIVVSAIEQFTNQKPGDFGDFDEAVKFYTSIRDGLTNQRLVLSGTDQ